MSFSKTGNAKPVIFVVSLTFVLTFAACTTKVADLNHDKSFNIHSILAGKIGIGGVTSPISNMPVNRANGYANIFHNTIREIRSF